jgi:hypothetical protein
MESNSRDLFTEAVSLMKSQVGLYLRTSDTTRWKSVPSIQTPRTKMEASFGRLGTVFAHISDYMFILLSGLLSVGSVATLAFLIGKAPEAYETGTGLRVVRPPAKLKLRTAARLPVAQVVP